MRAVTVSAPAKINLFLGVGARFHDGYHAVTTVMHAVGLADTVRIIDADELTVTTSVDLGIPEEDNLAFKAALAFAEELGQPVRAIIEIEKRIPSGAGLGGGSSDAAAVLAGLARMAGVAPDDSRMLKVAASLGADCPFLLLGGAAIMRGRGDELLRELPPIQADIALVKPPTPVPTSAAYGAFDESPLPSGDLRRVTDAVRFGDLAALGDALSNNLTQPVSALVPEVADALAWVSAEDGVFGAAMSGSGSAVFALCEGAATAERIAAAALARGWWGCATATNPDGVVVVDEEGCA